MGKSFVFVLALLFSIACAQENPEIVEDVVEEHLGFDCTKIELTSDLANLREDVQFKGIPAEATDKVTLFCSDMPEEVPCEMNVDKYVCKTNGKECKLPRVVVLGDDEMCPLNGLKGSPLAAALGDFEGEFIEAATVEQTNDMKTSNSNTYNLPAYAWVGIGLAGLVVVAIIVVAVMAARFKKTTESV